MNKKLKNYFEQLGFNVQGNNAYGSLNNCEVSVNVVMLDHVAPVKLHVNLYASDENKGKILRELQSLRLKYFIASADAYGIILGFNDPWTVGGLIKRIPEMLDKIFVIFTKYEAKGIGYCPLCGEELKEGAKQYNISGALITMDPECVNKVNEVIEAVNKDFKEAPNNYLKGTIGAVIGALVGAIAFIVLFFIGFISAITSLIAIVLGTYLYKKFGGKPNAIMVVIVSVVSIAAMLLSVWGIYVFAAETLALEYGFASTGLQAFNDMMTIPEFSKEFTSNLLMTVVFTAVGVIFEIVQLSKSVKRQGTIK